MGNDGDRQVDYATVTETPGRLAVPETLDALRTRYALAARLAAGKDVLELACGPGIGLGFLARSARRVVGGDCDEGLVKMAQDHYGDRVEIMLLDAERVPLPDAGFDVILLLEAIYYLPHAERFLAEARRLLRPGGAVLICSANPERPDFNHSPYTHRYFSARELGSLLAGQGFGVELAGAFPVGPEGAESAWRSAVRQAAVKLGLIPRSMAGKERIKRLFYRNLQPFPRELAAEGREVPLVSVPSDQPVTGFKVIFATGRLP